MPKHIYNKTVYQTVKQEIHKEESQKFKASPLPWYCQVSLMDHNSQKKDEFEEIRRQERMFNMMMCSKTPIEVKKKT